MTRRYWVPVSLLTGLLLVGCGAGANVGADVSGATGGQSADYGTTKQMVLDILKSADGKQAVTEVLTDPSTKQQIIVSDTDITKATQQFLESKQGQSFLSQQAKDPKFAAALAKAVQPDLVNMQKQLMKDPEYQKDMLVLLKSPDFTKQMETLMKSPEFRGQVMQIMTDALKTPSFRMQFQDALKQAVQESMQSSGGQGGQQQGGQQQGGGGQSGGGSSGGGGGS